MISSLWRSPRTNTDCSGSSRLVALLALILVSISHISVVEAWRPSLQYCRLRMMAGSSSQATKERYTLLGDYRVNLLSSSVSLEALVKQYGWKPFQDNSMQSGASSISRLWTVTRRSSAALAGAVGVDDKSGAPCMYCDDALSGERDICNLLATAAAPAHRPAPTYEQKVELVSWVDNEGKDLLPYGLSRLEVHRLNMLHRGAGILLKDKDGRIYVHQRSATKRIFPAMYDMFVGGVSGFGEPSLTTARREVKEELGVGGETAPLQSLFSCIVETSLNRCFVDVFEYEVQEHERVTIDGDEVQWVEAMSRGAIEDNLKQGTWAWVPDGLQVWDALKGHWEKEGR